MHQKHTLGALKMNQNNNYRTVYSTSGDKKNSDPPPRQPEPIDPQKIIVKIRLESKGRGGKSVSVIFNLPYNPAHWTKITKKLKSFCGSGGTFKGENIEIQGDQRQKIKTFFEKEGFTVKMAGG